MAETLLTVEHLIKKYGDQVILDDVSLDVKKGEVIVVVGPSGCGKSTLLRCINALEPIQGGVVKLGDEVIDPKSKSLTRLRQKIGMVFQSYDLFPHLTVLDNILLAPTKVQKRSKDEVKEEAMKLLRRVGLEEKAGSYPRELSGGQKQRVAIVRAAFLPPFSVAPRLWHFEYQQYCNCHLWFSRISIRVRNLACAMHILINSRITGILKVSMLIKN